MSFLPSTIPVDLIKKPYQQQKVSLHVLRLDLVHPTISGNKWFKLKEYLAAAEEGGKRNLVTFGGPFSNHIIATAALAHEQGLEAAGLIRGEPPSTLSQTLDDASKLGMHLFFLPRDQYKLKKIPEAVWEKFEMEKTVVIPEGGYGPEGASGAATILQGLDVQRFTHLAAPVGTGTTLAGLVTGSLPQLQVIGFSALKNNFGLEDEINALLPEHKRSGYRINHQYHFGGYAKHNKILIDFMNEWFSITGIPTDFVYTGKMFYALDDLIRKDFFAPGSEILAVHTGGLQGNRSLGKGTLIFMPN